MNVRAYNVVGRTEAVQWCVDVVARAMTLYIHSTEASDGAVSAIGRTGGGRRHFVIRLTWRGVCEHLLLPGMTPSPRNRNSKFPL